MPQKYIHYGSNKFDIGRFINVYNIPFMNKPGGGLWASRIDSLYGFKDFCKSNDMNGSPYYDFNKSFVFSLKDDAKIFNISSYEDYLNAPKCSYMHNNLGNIRFSDEIIDYEKMSSSYDAIELNYFSKLLSNEIIVFYNDINEYFKKSLKHKLNNWDCDCILIMNPDVIILD